MDPHAEERSRRIEAILESLAKERMAFERSACATFRCRKRILKRNLRRFDRIREALGKKIKLLFEMHPQTDVKFQAFLDSFR